MDYSSRYEGTSLFEPTYAAITARSYHRNFVMSSRLDGSVHRVADGVAREIWRALGTRAGAEPIDLEE